MNVCDEIIQRRDCGVVRCEVRSTSVPSIEELATAFGLLVGPDTYQEIGPETARAILVAVLHRDLAYGVILLPLDAAADLAGRFLDAARSPRCRYFSNGDVSQSPPRSWMPATDATFDTGILVWGSEHSACLWVEDED